MTARLFRHAPQMEAFRFGFDDPPAWMSHRVVHEWDGNGEWVRVYLRGGNTMRAFKGDWVVRDREGWVVDVVLDSVFQQDYTEVAE